MKLSLFLPAKPDIKWELGKQMGVNYAITKLHPDLTGMAPPSEIDTLAQVQKSFQKFGYELYGLESDEFDMSRIKYGLPGRDEDLERYCQMIHNLGELGIPMICYNFMPTGWFRTSTDVQGRGGAYTSEFSYAVAQRLPLASHGEFTEAQMWDNFTYFLKHVIPVAEKAEVQMALHPDDPPVSPLQGVGRIFTSAEAFRKAFSIVDSPVNGMCFCQATFRTMGEDIQTLAREFGEKKKIFFIHIRDIIGTKERFRETFHDNGSTDMVEMFRIYKEIGFDGPVRPDHAPTMAGEDHTHPGYESKGKIFATGYFKGIMDTLAIPIE